jgi:hypothetical protein
MPYLVNGLSASSVPYGYNAQPGETLLDHFPPLPDEVPSYDAALAAQSSAASSSALKAQAQAALDRSDETMIRQYEEGNPAPAAWVAYREALRAVVAGTSTSLPTQPAYPV